METENQTAAPVKASTTFTPLMERVAVPLCWLAAGYVLCMLTRPRKKALE